MTEEKVQGGGFKIDASFPPRDVDGNGNRAETRK
jgi:hypothetical protein